MIVNKKVNRNSELRNYKRELDAQRKANSTSTPKKAPEKVERNVSVKISKDKDSNKPKVTISRKNNKGPKKNV